MNKISQIANHQLPIAPTIGQSVVYLPVTMRNYFIGLYFVIFALLFAIYPTHIMGWYNWVLGGLGVTAFCYYANKLPKRWAIYTPKSFEHHLFWITILWRILWILFFSQFTFWLWGTPWEQPDGTSMDSTGYYETAMWFDTLLDNGRFWSTLREMATRSGVADLGYPVFLSFWARLGFRGILWTRIPNAIFEAVTCVFIYRIGRRNFGESVGRLAGIFLMLLPLSFMYAGITMKESLMIMIYTIAIYRLDLIIKGDKKGVWQILLAVGVTALLAFFRTSLAIVIVAAFLLGLILTKSTKRSKWKNRLLILLFIITLGASFATPMLEKQSLELQSAYEMSEDNFENRSRGNALVKNLNKAVFAPLMFTIPFPTMVDISGQTWQQLCSGGNYIKNILSLFTILLFLVLLLSKQWRKYVFIMAALCGYLAALALSSFAHSGRFHQPAIPLEMLFAAAGLYLCPQYIKKFWKPALLMELIIVIGWNWFKMRGRGMI